MDDYNYQVCISYQDIWLGQTQIVTYANTDELIYGGSLQNGVIDGLFLAVKQIANQKGILLDRRKIKEQLILLAVIKGDNFKFYGSSRAKLDMPKVRKNIKEFIVSQISDYLADNENIKKQLLNKLTKEE